jgi:hypothetical protein
LVAHNNNLVCSPHIFEFGTPVPIPKSEKVVVPAGTEEDEKKSKRIVTPRKSEKKEKHTTLFNNH